jgi:hypothetical protein
VSLGGHPDHGRQYRDPAFVTPYYEDRHGRPISEGDIVRSHAGEINAVEVIGSAYTEQGRRLLAAHGMAYPVAAAVNNPRRDDPSVMASLA